MAKKSPDVSKRRVKRSLVVTVDGNGRMICVFRVSGRKTAQSSYEPSNDELTIVTGEGEAYLWLAGKIK